MSPTGKSGKCNIYLDCMDFRNSFVKVRTLIGANVAEEIRVSYRRISLLSDKV